MQAGVQVWTAHPDRLGGAACTEFMAVLDEGERDRAMRLRSEADRHAFIVAHAMRRIALGLALAVDPQELRFGSGMQGQPVLLGRGDDVPSFSLSRSRGLVAVAISTEGAVGVDVEAVRDGVDGALLSPYVALGRDAIRTDADFYVQWTALEAYWKARGLGLSTSHPRIRLAPLAEDCWEVLLADDGSPAGMVAMRLPCSPSHVLTLACEAPMNVRLVELDALAQAPPVIADRPCSGREGDCGIAAAPNTFNA